MPSLWLTRLRNIALGLFAATLAALGLSVILRAAGDTSGGQALLGAAVVMGMVLLADLTALGVWSLWCGKSFVPKDTVG
jgi:hypothetical protein